MSSRAPLRRLIVLSLWLTWFALPPGPASAQTPLAVVVNAKNDVADIKGAQLTEILLGRVSVWPNGRRITVVLREPESAERTAVLQACCHMSVDSYRKRMLQAVFTGEASAEPKTVTSAAFVKKFVANVPGAIGFIPLSEVDDTVRVVSLAGHRPGEAGYTLTVP